MRVVLQLCAGRGGARDDPGTAVRVHLQDMGQVQQESRPQQLQKYMLGHRIQG